MGLRTNNGICGTAVSARLKNLPESRIVQPNPMIAGRALEALRFTGCDTTLRELYANLLASALDSKTAKNCSPAFVKVLEQFTPDEAKILNVASFDLSYASFIIPFISLDKKIGGMNAKVLEPFTTIQFEANCDFPDFIDVYIDNLKRLGVIKLCNQTFNAGVCRKALLGEKGPVASSDLFDKLFEPLETHPLVIKRLKLFAEHFEKDTKLEFYRDGYDLTQFGGRFYELCVISYEHS